MGGRGGGSGFGRGWSGSYTATTQQGATVDLDTPLMYSRGTDESLTGANRKALTDWEKSRADAKVEYAQYMRSEGTLLGEKRGGRGSVSNTGFDLVRTKIMTHIHPRGTADERNILSGTFSPGDMGVFIDFNDMTTMRAVGGEGTYSITKQPGFRGGDFYRNYTNTEKELRKSLDSQAKSLRSEYKAGRITAKEYNAGADRAFNNYLEQLHNSLIKGQKEYGYKYYLERR